MGEVITRTHARDLGGRVKQGVGLLTGDHVGLGAAGDREDHVGVRGAGAAQHVGMRGMTLLAAEVKTVLLFAQTLAIGVDHGDVVGLRHQGLRHRRSHLPRAEYDDLHAVLPDASRCVVWLLTLFFWFGFFVFFFLCVFFVFVVCVFFFRLLRHLADAAADLPQMFFVFCV